MQNAQYKWQRWVTSLVELNNIGSNPDLGVAHQMLVYSSLQLQIQFQMLPSIQDNENTCLTYPER